MVFLVPMVWWKIKPKISFPFWVEVLLVLWSSPKWRWWFRDPADNKGHLCGQAGLPNPIPTKPTQQIFSSKNSLYWKLGLLVCFKLETMDNFFSLRYGLAGPYGPVKNEAWIFFPFWAMVLMVLWSHGPPQNGGGNSGIQLTTKGICVVQLVCLIPFQLNQLCKFFFKNFFILKIWSTWSTGLLDNRNHE